MNASAVQLVGSGETLPVAGSKMDRRLQDGAVDRWHRPR